MNKENKKPVWATIAAERMGALKLTQDDLLDAFEVKTRGAVGHYFTGRREPSIKQLQNLAKKLDLNISTLLGEGELALPEVINYRNTSNLPLVTWGKLVDWLSHDYEPKEFIHYSFGEATHGSFIIQTTESEVPEYREGSYICIDPAVQAKNKDDVLVLAGNQIYFRRLLDTSEGQVLQALNPDMPNQMIPMPEGAKLCGVAVASWFSRRVS